MTESPKVIDLKAAPRAKVLVAEDEKDIASLIEDWLSDSYDVTVALNGKTVVQKAIWHQPQAILLDVVMPDMGGYDVVRLLQGAAQTKNIPVIVMTAKNFDDSTIKMIKAEGNVYGFLNKPFKPSELIKMLETVMKGGRVLAPADGTPPGTVPSSPAHAPEAIGTVLSSGFDVVKTGPASTPEPAVSESVPELQTESRATDPAPPTPSPTREIPRAKHRREKPKQEEEEDVPSFRFRRFVSVALGGGLVSVFLAGVLFGVAEWTCRRAEEVMGRPFFTPPLYPASRFNSFLPYQWNDPKNPNPSYWHDGRVVYQFNQWGLRGPEFPLVTPNGVHRILLLGGTATFGPGVGERDTIAARLETLLNEKRSGSFQVINAGLWSFSPDEQWAFVKGQGFNFKPESIFWLCENREPGGPSTEGVRWLAAHRWLVSTPFAESRFVQLFVQLKMRGQGDPVPKEDSPLFRQAEKMAKEQKVALTIWILPRGDSPSARRPGSEKILSFAETSDAFNVTVAERLARAVENKSE